MMVKCDKSLTYISKDTKRSYCFWYSAESSGSCNTKVTKTPQASRHTSHATLRFSDFPENRGRLLFTSFFFATRLNNRMLLTRLNPRTTPTNQDKNMRNPSLGSTITDTERNTSMAKQMSTFPATLLLEFSVSTLNDWAVACYNERMKPRAQGRRRPVSRWAYCQAVLQDKW